MCYLCLFANVFHHIAKVVDTHWLSGEAQKAHQNYMEQPKLETHPGGCYHRLKQAYQQPDAKLSDRKLDRKHCSGP